MTLIAQELDAALRGLDPTRAKDLEKLVRDALALAGHSTLASAAWPAGYFEATAGALAGERFERPEQGSLPDREVW
jgi:hypothetical protein